MAAERIEDLLPPELLSDDGVFYPSNDDERMWVLSREVRQVVTNVLEADQAERVLRKLDRLFDQWGIYTPGGGRP